MNKIINELLNTNARVIIPDFGAFIIKQKNPRLVVFNEFLRYNDGLLIDYISASDKVEKSTAKAKVNRFVEEINQTLARGEEFKIEGLGTLARDDTGKLTFSEKTTASPDSQQKTKKSATAKDASAKATPGTLPEQKKADEVKQREEAKASREEATVKKEPVEKKKEPAEAVEREEKKEKEQAKETKSKEEEPVEITFEKEDIKPPDTKEEAKSKEKKISVTPIKTAEIREEPKRAPQAAYTVNKPAQKTTRKSNSKQIIIWILLIVIVNAAIAAWFFYNDQITGLFKRDKLRQYEMTTGTEAEQESTAGEQVYEPDEATETQAGADLPQEIEQEKEIPVAEPAAQPVMHDRKAYYIVAGCFREESNADQLVTDLRKRGFQAEKFGKIGNLHAVSFSSFTDKSAALEELKKIRNTEQEGAWIAYH